MKPLCAVLSLSTLIDILPSRSELAWYAALDEEMRAKVDQLTSALAWKRFGRLLDQLALSEARVVLELARRLVPS
jgi:hypothetical protein